MNEQRRYEIAQKVKSYYEGGQTSFERWIIIFPPRRVVGQGPLGIGQSSTH